MQQTGPKQEMKQDFSLFLTFFLLFSLRSRGEEVAIVGFKKKAYVIQREISLSFDLFLHPAYTHTLRVRDTS